MEHAMSAPGAERRVSGPDAVVEEEEAAPQSLPLLDPQPGDVVNLSLQVNVAGAVRVSLLTISSRIAAPHPVVAPSPQPPIRAPLVPPALAHLPPPSTRIRILGHSRSEARDGSEFIAYIVEYLQQPPSTPPSTPSSASSPPNPFVTTKRFSDFYALHCQLSLSFVCLPPFPPRTLLRSLSDEGLIRDRELALTLYLQLIAQREDIRRTGALERFLHAKEGEGIGGTASDSERERDVDLSMKVEEGLAERRRAEERRMEEACSQRFDLLVDQFHVLHARVDIDAVREHSTKEQEMRQTTFSNPGDGSARTQRPSKHPATAPAPPPSTATLSFLTRSATLAISRALLPSSTLLLVAAGDSSKLGHLDAYITGLWTGWLDGRKQAEKLERERSKPEVYRAEDLEPHRTDEEPREAEQPLGALYAFHRATADDQWQPTLSLFFERELVDAVWDPKRGWVYLLADDGLLHVYSPLLPDWSRVRKVWSVRVHSGRIASAHFSPQLDALLSLDVGGHLATFDLASLSLTSAFAEPSRGEEGVEALTRALGWKGRGSGLAHDAVNDRVFIGGSDGAVAVWDAGKVGVHRERLLGLMKGHDGPVKSIAFDDGSDVLASGGADGALLLWEVRPPGEEAVSTMRGKVEGHGAEVTCVAFSDDGSWVLSGDADGRVLVTSRESALPVMAFQAHEKSVTSLAMRAGLLVTGSEDRSACVWLCHYR